MINTAPPSKTFFAHFGGKSNRFHAAARIEASADDEGRLNAEIRNILEAANVRDPRNLRWKDLDGAKERFAAQKLFEFAVEEMGRGKLRAEIEVWDMRVSNRGARGESNRAIDSTGKDSEKRSIAPLSMLAGLFAGLVSFSYEKHDEYAAWLRRSGPQCALYSNEVAEFLPSKVSVERFQVLRHFLNLCVAKSLSVSMVGAGGHATKTSARSDGAPHMVGAGRLPTKTGARSDGAPHPVGAGGHATKTSARSDGAPHMVGAGRLPTKTGARSDGAPHPEGGLSSILEPFQISFKVD